jgi:SAM-dependent methyltransferase
MLIEADAEAPPFTDDAFDVVCSLNVLHHLRSLERHVAVLADLCRPGGTVFLCTFAGGHTVTMRVADWWLKRRNDGWQGMSTPAALDHALAREPRLEACERDSLTAGVWRLQIYRLKTQSSARDR